MIGNKCLNCGQFAGSTKYCSYKCGVAFRRAERHKLNPPINLSPTAAGHLAKLIVEIDLIRRGLEYFKSPLGGPLVVYRGNWYVQIDIRTGTLGPKSDIIVNRGPARQLLAIVLRDELKVIYRDIIDGNCQKLGIVEEEADLKIN